MLLKNRKTCVKYFRKLTHLINLNKYRDHMGGVGMEMLKRRAEDKEHERMRKNERERERGGK
jgi:hypothetical protein